MREHWKELGFWRWWWHNRVPSAVKALAALVLLGGIVAGGWFAAQKLPLANASADGSQTIVRTVERVVTVQARGKVVVKRVPVIQKVYVANKAARVKTLRVASTVYGTRTVVQTVAAHRARTLTLPARTTTVTRTRTRTITVTKTVPTTTVQWRVITVVEKQKPVTVTVTVTAP
jgi:predicted membrane metal-binding protein